MAQIQRGIKQIEERHEKPPVSEFDDHALWIQELDDYRISDKYMKLDDEQKQMVLQTMNEHTDWIQQMVAPQPDPDTDPSLKPTTAAQDNADQIAQQPPPQAGPEDMSAVGPDAHLEEAQAAQLGSTPQ